MSHGGASRGRAHAARHEMEETVEAVVPIQEQIVARTKSKSKAWKVSKTQNFSFFVCRGVFALGKTWKGFFGVAAINSSSSGYVNLHRL